MSCTDKGQSQIIQIIIFLTEVSGYVAGIVAYFLALTGRMKTDYPHSVAVLTLLVTTIVLWTWRWPHISRTKPVGESRMKNKTQKSRSGSCLDRLIDLLRSSSRNTYLLPLTQRRIEVGIMFALTVIAIGRTGTEFPKIMEELNPPSFVLEPPCELVGEQNTLRVVIADFFETSSNEILFEERLQDEMQKEVEGKIEICRLKKAMENRQQALDAQNETNAGVLIWGRSDAEAVDVHLEVAGWDILEEVIWSFRNKADDFQMNESAHLTFLTQFSFSLLRYINDQIPQARDELKSALDMAQGADWTFIGDNKADLAEACFLLGLIYEKDETLAEADRLEKARRSYETAIELNPKADDAIFNKGYICTVLGDNACAMEAFTMLIDRQSKLAASAYISRSYLQPQDLAEQDLTSAIRLDPGRGYSERAEARLMWGNLSGAISDYKNAIQLAQDNPYLYHGLGKAQLLSGNFEEAIKTYNAALPYILDEETRQYFVNELKSLHPPPNANGRFQDTVDQIIRVLEEAKAS